MILIDYREETVTKKAKNLDLIPHIQRIGIKVEKADLQFGDAAFEGRGPFGTISIGVERKSVHDMLSCIDDARYSAHQRLGMKQMYTLSVLIIEGHWRPHDPDGVLMEGYNGGISWGFSRYRSIRTMYHKLYRYLISVSLSGVLVSYSRDPFHTAFNICEWYHYFEKPWTGHTALQELQKVAIPTLEHRPSLTRRWAADLDGVDRVLSERIEQRFVHPITLACAEEDEWLEVPGVGPKTAKSIIKAIWGR